MFREIIFIFSAIFANVCADQGSRTVYLHGIGGVNGAKYWNGDFYEFYGIPYATVPKGRDRFKAPLPVEPWEGIRESNNNIIVCEQVYLTEEEKEDEVILHGEEECLFMNLLVPEIASKENLVPVIVYIHSGAFGGGNGNMAKFHYLARHDVIVISFNYRIGAIGFACLGTEDIPGNAGLKDQLAALKWINKNIKEFGGDPNKVTLAGFSVGAAMAELLALSKTTDGLISKLILESGSALSPFTINRDPINTARNIAISIGYNDTGNIEDLNEFYLKASIVSLAVKSKNFFLTNSTFGFSPCIESAVNKEAILTESPFDILNKGDYKKIPVLTGFANMEGISRLGKFDEWSEMMNKKFSDFLPADLLFKDDKTRDALINDIKKSYFKGEDVSHDTLQGYIDYFSDSMFKYGIMKSAKLHAENSTLPVYLYEFVYVGKLSAKYQYMDIIKGASHRDQTSYILDFFDFTKSYRDLDTRDRMTSMWTDFAKYEDPTAYESSLIDFKWLTYTNDNPNYLEIGNKLKMKKDLFAKRYLFWDRVYTKYHWNPTAPTIKKNKK